jgi:hypothetical protein
LNLLVQPPQRLVRCLCLSFPGDWFRCPLWFWQRKQCEEEIKVGKPFCMFVAADKAWYIQFFWVQLQDNYLGECVSSSTVKGVHQGSRSVADGLDLHSATNTGDWVRSLWEHGRVCVGVFDTAKLRGGGWILRWGKLWWRRAQLLGRRM